MRCATQLSRPRTLCGGSSIARLTTLWTWPTGIGAAPSGSCAPLGIAIQRLVSNGVWGPRGMSQDADDDQQPRVALFARCERRTCARQCYVDRPAPNAPPPARLQWHGASSRTADLVTYRQTMVSSTLIHIPADIRNLFYVSATEHLAAVLTVCAAWRRTPAGTLTVRSHACLCMPWLASRGHAATERADGPAREALQRQLHRKPQRRRGILLDLCERPAAPESGRLFQSARASTGLPAREPGKGRRGGGGALRSGAD